MHLYLDAHGTDGRVIEGSGQQTAAAVSNGRWQKLSMVYTVPQGAETIFPQGRITGPPGDADFDNFSLKRLDDGQELLRNGGLEQQIALTLKDPVRLRRIRELLEAGRGEVVGGAYTQPILYLLGQESVVAQLVLGRRAVEEALGAKVRTYVAQEPDW